LIKRADDSSQLSEDLAQSVERELSDDRTIVQKFGESVSLSLTNMRMRKTGIEENIATLQRDLADTERVISAMEAADKVLSE
ncbi:MAG: hypothetical protein KDE20_18845, partial [Caldilineaceae bacterium]|nr:hypothetical protein [Caldilineaceae bacterium]